VKEQGRQQGLDLLMLTLILPGKVKVDLAKIDIKFWTKLPIPVEMSLKYF
jgi:hypothetical protein